MHVRLKCAATWLGFPCLAVALLVVSNALASDPNSSATPLQLTLHREDIVYVPVEAFGETYTFILDTGAAYSAFDSEHRPRLSKPLNRPWELTLASRQVKAHTCPEMKIGGETFQSPKFIVSLDLESRRRSTGQFVSGVLGMDFLKSHVVRINFDDGAASIYSRASSVNGASQTAVLEMDMDKSGLPSIDLQVAEDQRMSFQIVTGCAEGLYLDTKHFDKLLRQKKLTLNGTPPSGIVFKDRSPRSGVLDQVQLGPHRLQNLVVREGQSNLIGLQFLERFDTELDFPKHRVVFRPGLRMNEADRKNVVGINWERSGDKTLVQDVNARSVADQAGVRKGDVILQVNGVSTSTMTIPKLRALRYETGANLTLKLERKGKIRTAILKLSDQEEVAGVQSVSLK